MPKTGDRAVPKQRSSWNKVASWAGIGNNREGTIRMKDEATMQEDVAEQANGEVEVGARTGQEAGEQRGPEAVREAYAPADGGGSQETAAQEIAQLRGEKDQLLDRLARLQAEFDNARKREAKERADTRDYAVSNTVEPFLSVMDNFQLALKADGTKEQL